MASGCSGGGGGGFFDTGPNPNPNSTVAVNPAMLEVEDFSTVTITLIDSENNPLENWTAQIFLSGDPAANTHTITVSSASAPPATKVCVKAQIRDRASYAFPSTIGRGPAVAGGSISAKPPAWWVARPTPMA